MNEQEIKQSQTQGSKRTKCMAQKKRIAIGESDFKSLIQGNSYYVDKTLFIQEVLEQGSKVLLIPRPRRFGKTINLSTRPIYP